MTKRGRPKTKQIGPDLGTPELQRYKKMHLFTDPLDLALQRQLIQENHYHAGLTYRWLYTLQFGSPHIKSYDWRNVKGKDKSKYNDEQWLAEKEKIYLSARLELTQRNLHDIIIDICILSIPQDYLIYPNVGNDRLQKLQEGLELIDSVFKKTRQSKTSLL